MPCITGDWVGVNTAPTPPLVRSKPHFGWWALLYAVMVFYASTLVTVTGIAIVWRDPEQMLWKLINIPLIEHGSDQRADWMGNLGMLIPLGFLLTGMLLPAPRPMQRRWGKQGPLYGGVARRVIAAIVALVLCFTYIVAVKYVQLFTPRTVNLNYIIAQTSGAVIGILCCAVGIDAITAAMRRIREGSHAGLVSLLRLYTLTVFIFVLAPFDVVISPGDFADRLASLPNSLFSIPGADRALHLRALIILGGAGMMVPVGMLLQAARPNRSLAGVVGIGLLLVCAMLVLSMCILSAAPTLVSVPVRLGGILAGAVVYRGLGRWDIAPLRRVLPYLAGLAVLPYLAALLVANSLVSLHWRSPAETWAVLDPRFFLPFWTHYMVPKAQAIKSVVVHALMYAPVGAMIWAWFGGGRWQLRLAAVLAFMVAVTIEVGRMMAPGLMLDLNNAAIGTVAAGFTVGFMRILWTMLENVRAARMAHDG